MAPSPSHGPLPCPGHPYSTHTILINSFSLYLLGRSDQKRRFSLDLKCVALSVSSSHAQNLSCWTSAYHFSKCSGDIKSEFPGRGSRHLRVLTALAEAAMEIAAATLTSAGQADSAACLEVLAACACLSLALRAFSAPSSKENLSASSRPCSCQISKN